MVVVVSANQTLLISDTVGMSPLGLFPEVVSPQQGEDEDECDHAA